MADLLESTGGGLIKVAEVCFIVALEDSIELVQRVGQVWITATTE